MRSTAATPVPLLAFGDEAAGEGEIIENAVRVRPLPEQMIGAEKVVVAEAGVRDHQRLHRHGVLLHQIGDAGVGVDDDLIGEACIAARGTAPRRGRSACRSSSAGTSAAGRRGIRVQHLLGGDHLDLVGIGGEAELAAGDLLAGAIGGVELLEVPLGAFEQQCPCPGPRRFLAEQLGESRPTRRAVPTAGAWRAAARGARRWRGRCAHRPVSSPRAMPNRVLLARPVST